MADYTSTGTFNKKYFNERAFGAYYDTIPQERLNLLIKSGVLQGNNKIREMFASQTGAEYVIIPMIGRLKGKPVNYDGKTKYDEGKTLPTYKQGVVVIGRKDKFYEDDFTYDVTSKKDFMSQVADQLGDYWDSAWEDVLLIITKALFSMKSDAGKVFASKHTYDISGETESSVAETTLNTALQKACGDRRRNFKLAVANSVIVTNLEGKKLVTNLRYNDPNGIERELNVYTWNGKLLIEYDEITEEEGDPIYAKTSDKTLTEGKTYYTKSGTNYTAVAEPSVENIGNYYEVSGYGDSKYVTYVFGKGAFDYEDLGAKVPHEMDRDADNDRDYLYERQRKVMAPHGVSYLMKNQATDSPTDEELADGANWDLVVGSDGNTYNHKEIAIARIISKG
nr:MAG TPA: major capsid protein [Caudoviricetes sp.]